MPYSPPRRGQPPARLRQCCCKASKTAFQNSLKEKNQNCPFGRSVALRQLTTIYRLQPCRLPPKSLRYRSGTSVNRHVRRNRRQILGFFGKSKTSIKGNIWSRRLLRSTKVSLRPRLAGSHYALLRSGRRTTDLEVSTLRVSTQISRRLETSLNRHVKLNKKIG